MINKETYLGIFCGTCLAIGVLYSFDRMLTPHHQTPLQINYRSPLHTDTGSLRFENFNPSKSILSQIPSRLDPLIDCYAQMSAQELQEEIQKIDNEYAYNPAGTTRDAIAILFLAYKWAFLNSEAATAYGESPYLSSNKIFISSEWLNLVIHAWASKSPESAYKYINEFSNEQYELEKQNLPHQSRFQDTYSILGTFMGKYSPTSAYYWATSIPGNPNYSNIYYEIAGCNSIISIAWNHPECLVKMDYLGTIIYDAALIWRENDPKKAQQWIESFPPEGKKYIQRALTELNAKKTFESTLDYYNSMDGFTKKLATYDIIETLRKKDLYKSIKWAIKNNSIEEFKQLSSIFSPITTSEAKVILKILTENPLDEKSHIIADRMHQLHNFNLPFEDVLIISQAYNKLPKLDEKNFQFSTEAWKLRGCDMREIERWIDSSDCSVEQKDKFKSLLLKHNSQNR